MGLFGKKKTPAEILAEGRAQYVKGDLKKAFLTLHGLAAKGDPLACYYIGRIYLERKEKQLAQSFLTTSAKGGNRDAARLLAERFGVRDYLPAEAAAPAAPEPEAKPAPNPVDTPPQPKPEPPAPAPQPEPQPQPEAAPSPDMDDLFALAEETGALIQEAQAQARQFTAREKSRPEPKPEPTPSLFRRPKPRRKSLSAKCPMMRCIRRAWSYFRQENMQRRSHCWKRLAP